MRALIIGAGKAGWHLAETLCKEGHDVVVVDNNVQALSDLESQLDVLTAVGHGADPALLEEVDIGKCDLVVAFTNQDEVNIFACAYAKSAGVPNRVARLDNPALVSPTSRLRLDEIGVDLAVSRYSTIASELHNILRLPGTLEVVDLLDDMIQVVGFRVSLDSPLTRAPLQTVAEPEMLGRVRVIAVKRGDALIVPRGDTQLLIGDDVYAACEPDYTPTLLNWACPERISFQKIIIAGGGTLGRTLAKLLEPSSVQVVVIEERKDRAEQCATVLQKALVIHGNALEEENLKNAGIVPGTAFVAATGTDENNIINCLLAEKLNANFTLAQITKAEYVSIINSQSLLDRAVSPYVAMSNAVLHFIRGQYVKSATVLHGLPGELLEVILTGGNKWTGHMIKELKIPKGTMIAAVQREGRVLIPTGNLLLLAEDRLLMFARPDSLSRIESMFGH